jgi:dolichol-phosphate mannosyltransferase
MNKYLTVVIPTYNEVQNLPDLVSAVLDLPLKDVGVLVVDDASPDGTGQVADELANRSNGRVFVIHRDGKQGLGTAYLTGFRQAIEWGVERIAQMDADFSHPPQILPELVDALDTCDLVIGSRYIQGGSVDHNWPVWRKSLSAFGNIYARTILRAPVHDLTSGFKVWRGETLAMIPFERVRANGYAFQIEMTYLAYRLGYTIREIPFYFPDRGAGRSKMSLSIQWEAAVRVWQLLYNYRDIHRGVRGDK